MTRSGIGVPIYCAAVPQQLGSTKQRVWPHALTVDDTIFVSAQAGVRVDGTLVGAETAVQFHQALENVRRVLEAADFSFRNVVKIRILLRDAPDYEQLQKVRNPYYREHFPEGDYPASTALVVRDMPREGSRVEVDVVACKRKTMFDAPGKIVKRIPLDLDAQPLWRLGGVAGDLLWTTGQPGLDLDAQLVGASVAEQLQRSLDNVGWILDAGEFDWKAVSKLNLFLGRISDHELARVVLDRLLCEHFPAGDFPACSVVEAGMPPPGMIVEAEVIATRLGPRRTASYSKSTDSASLSSAALRAGEWAMSSLHLGQGGGSFRQQTADAVTAMTASLSEIGSDAEDLAQLTIWLSDLGATQTVSDTCASLLPALPATTIIRTSFPSQNLLVGVEGIAR